LVQTTLNIGNVDKPTDQGTLYTRFSDQQQQEQQQQQQTEEVVFQVPANQLLPMIVQIVKVNMVLRDALQSKILARNSRQPQMQPLIEEVDDDTEVGKIPPQTVTTLKKLQKNQHKSKDTMQNESYQGWHRKDHQDSHGLQQKWQGTWAKEPAFPKEQEWPKQQGWPKEQAWIKEQEWKPLQPPPPPPAVAPKATGISPATVTAHHKRLQPSEPSDLSAQTALPPWKKAIQSWQSWSPTSGHNHYPPVEWESSKWPG
jgi:hypothetical protein